MVIQSQEAVKNHIFRIENSTRRASSTESDMAREDCALAKRAIESGNYFFPSVMGVYLRGDSLDDLYDKEAHKYVEGVILCNRFKGLFRNVPPRLALALAMTEKIEKAERQKLMQQYSCNEVEAAMRVAQSLSRAQM